MDTALSSLLQTQGPPVLQTIVGVAAFIAALGIIWKAPYIHRPVAYVGHRLIGDPITEWFRRLLSEEATRVIHAELKVPNGGASIADLSIQLHGVENRLVEQGAYIHREVHRINGQLGMIWRDWAVDHGIDPDDLPEPQPSPKEPE